MDFARKQLEKYGWYEGKGLGKQENGITSPIKPRLKFDKTGVGHDPGADFTNNWWENVYNKASQNIKINDKDGNIEVKLNSADSVEITTKNYSLRDFKQKNNNMEYGTFLKTARLTEDGIVNYNVAPPEEHSVIKFAALTDEELFNACGGRTAHKGARHGLKFSGKLSRIEKQERLLLKKLQNVSITDEDSDKTEKKLKKLSKNKDKIDEKEDLSDQGSKKKKKKKKRKCVSFNETVTEIHTQDLDTSSQSNESIDPPVILKTKIKDRDRFQEDTNTPDEGIEQDCDMKTENGGQECFAEAQQSKKERKEKKNRATDRFLQNLEKCKRKHDEDMETLHTKKHCVDIVSKFRYKKKRRRRAEIAINSITASLDQVCKISDTE